MPQDSAYEKKLRDNIDTKVCPKLPTGSSTTYQPTNLRPSDNFSLGNATCHSIHIATHAGAAALRGAALPALNSTCNFLPFTSESSCNSLIPPTSAAHDLGRMESHSSRLMTESVFPAMNSVCHMLPDSLVSGSTCNSLFGPNK